MPTTKPSPPLPPDDFTSENAISLNSLSRSLARSPAALVHSSVAFPLDTPEFIARTKLFSPPLSRSRPLAFPLLPFPHKKCLSGVGTELFWGEIRLIYWMASFLAPLMITNAIAIGHGMIFHTEIGDREAITS